MTPPCPRTDGTNNIYTMPSTTTTEMDPPLRRLVLGVLGQFVLYIPETTKRKRLQLVGSYFFDQTWFSWIGGAFGPVFITVFRARLYWSSLTTTLAFLTNEEPAKFHIHTIVKTSNGGDYGYAFEEKLGLVETPL